MLAGYVARLRARPVLAQNRDDQVAREPLPLHPSVLILALDALEPHGVLHVVYAPPD